MSGDARSVLRRLGATAPLALLAASLPALGGFLLLMRLPALGEWLRGHDGAGIALYAGGLALASGLALLPTYMPAVLGGWAFKFSVGFPAAMAGILGGAIIGYLIARRATGERVTSLLDEHPRWRAIYDGLMRSGYARALLIISLVRLSPSSPFAITNLVLAATRVPPSQFILGTLIGLAPRTGLVVFLAAHLSQLDPDKLETRWIFIGGIAVTVLVIAIIGLLAQKAVRHVTATPSDPPAA